MLVNIIWLILLVICLTLFWRQKFLLSPTALFFLYFSLVFPISHLTAYYLDIPSFFFDSPSTIPIEKIWHVLGLVWFGFTSFCIGRFVLPRVKVSWWDVEIIQWRLAPLLILSVIIAIAGAAIVVHQVGGLSFMLENMEYLRSEGLRGLGAGTYAATTLVPTTMQFWLMFALKNKSRRYSLVILIINIAACLLGGLFGFRGPVFVMLIQVACVVYLRTGKPTKRQSALAILLIAILISVSGLLRIALTAGDLAFLAMKSAPSLVLQETANSTVTRTRGVEMLVIMSDYMEHGEYHYFVQNVAESAHAIIPSFIFPKSLSLSEVIGTEVYGKYLFSQGIIHDYYGGVSYTLIGEGYWNLGIMGVAIVCCVIGYALQIVDACYRPANISYLQIVFFKTFASYVVAYIEVPQLAINSISISLFTNLVLLTVLSLPVFGNRVRVVAPSF